MADYSQLIDQMCQAHGVCVRRWRTNMSGKAWRVYHSDGRVENCIESPHPKTPISLSIFLHEIGHHVIGFDRYKKRCEEEYHVWVWAIAKMRELGVEPDEKVHKRFDASMRYAVGKAVRRGVKTLPEPLMQFIHAAA